MLRLPRPAIAASLLLALAVVSGCGVFPSASPRQGVTVRLGVGQNALTNAAADQIVRVLGLRMHALGLDGGVRRDGPASFVVDLPSEAEAAAALPLLVAPGRVSIVRVPLAADPPAVGAQVPPWPELFGPEAFDPAAARTGEDPTTGGRIVNIGLLPEPAAEFETFTEIHVGHSIAIVLDSRVLTAPVIQGAIPGGQIQISSGAKDGFPLRDGSVIVAYLQSGPLPISLVVDTP